jgi:hypothetical protein
MAVMNFRDSSLFATIGRQQHLPLFEQYLSLFVLNQRRGKRGFFLFQPVPAAPRCWWGPRR